MFVGGKYGICINSNRNYGGLHYYCGLYKRRKAGALRTEDRKNYQKKNSQVCAPQESVG